MILESPRIVRQSLKALEVAFNSKISPQQNNGNTLSILSKLFRERRRVFLDLAQFLFSKVLKDFSENNATGLVVVLNTLISARYEN